MKTKTEIKALINGNYKVFPTNSDVQLIKDWANDFKTTTANRLYLISNKTNRVIKQILL